MKVNLYLDRFGGVPAIKKFFVDVFKSAIAGAVTYILSQLTNAEISTGELVGIVFILRGAPRVS